MTITTFRTRPEEISATRWWGNGNLDNAIAVLKWFGDSFPGAKVGTDITIETVGDPNSDQGASLKVVVGDTELVAGPGGWFYIPMGGRLDQLHACTHDHFMGHFAPGGVSRLELMTPRDYSEALFEPDVMVQAFHVPSTFCNSNERQLDDDDVIELWFGYAAAAVAEMLGRTEADIRKIGDACAGNGPWPGHEDDDEDDHRYRREAAMESAQQMLGGGWGWVVGLTTPVRRDGKRSKYGVSFTVSWGWTETSYHWAPTYYEAIEKGLAAIEATHAEQRASV